jgi:hypothetical protein
MAQSAKEIVTQRARELADGHSTAILVVALLYSITDRTDIPEATRREMVKELRRIGEDVAGADEMRVV